MTIIIFANAAILDVESGERREAQHVVIEDEPYMLSSEGYLMPSKKGQRPPDLTYFNLPKK